MGDKTTGSDDKNNGPDISEIPDNREENGQDKVDSEKRNNTTVKTTDSTTNHIDNTADKTSHPAPELESDKKSDYTAASNSDNTSIVNTGEESESTQVIPALPLEPIYDEHGQIVDYREPPNFGHLDLRVGIVHLIGRHPKPEKNVRFIEKIIIGPEPADELPVESGVPKMYPILHLINLKAVILCNIKPVTSRGLESKIVVLCARKGKKMEFIEAPSHSKAGDKIVVRGYKRNPQLPYLPNIFQTFGEDLRVNEDKQVVYKGFPLQIDKKEGFITTKTLSNCSIGTVMNYKNI